MFYYKQYNFTKNQIERFTNYSKLKKLKDDAKYNDRMRIERNSYLIETEILKNEIKELEVKVLELETELYFKRRNKRISEMYNEKD